MNIANQPKNGRKVCKGYLEYSFISVETLYNLRRTKAKTYYVVAVPLDSTFNLENSNNEIEPIYFSHDGIRYNITNILEKIFGNNDNIMLKPSMDDEKYTLDDITIYVRNNILFINRIESESV